MSERTDDLLSELTLDERAALTAGLDMWHGTGVERLGIRGIKVSDGPNGARGAFWNGTTSACTPCGTALGATWNVELVKRVGHVLGDETRSKGADMLLAPTVNIHRSPLAGRNFECYSEDPFLSARMAVAMVIGVQSKGVGTAIKHFVANDSEFERHTISSEVDDRSLREIYLVPFEAAVVEARSLSIMAGYNRLRGTYCAESPFLQGVLDEWGFDGFMISDWWGVKSTIGTGNAGVDLEMPGPALFLGAKLADAVRAGNVAEAALDGKVRRLLGVMERLGVLESTEASADRSVDVPAHHEILRAAARESIVLLRNEPVEGGRPVLPLRRDDIRRIAVIGPDADVHLVQGGGSAAVNPHYSVTVLDGLRAACGDAVEIVHERGCDAYRILPPLDHRWTRPTHPSHPDHGMTVEYFDGRELAGEPIDVIHTDEPRLTWIGDPSPMVTGGNFSARVSATFIAPCDGPFEFGLVVGGQARVFFDGEVLLEMWDEFVPGEAFFGLGSREVRATRDLVADEAHHIVVESTCFEGLSAAALLLGGLPKLGDDGIDRAAAAAADADVAIIVVGLNQDWESEGQDRADWELPGDQSELVERVVAAQPATAVLVQAGAPVAMEWADTVPAIAQIWYLGQETGNAVADLLVGDHSPSGRLPTTFPMRFLDHPAVENYPGEHDEVRYGENLFVGYRWYDRREILPRYAFGHGLSYTTFEHSNIRPDRTSFGPGDIVRVAVDVTNTGGTAASEVVQIYVHDPVSRLSRPVQELKAFAKVLLEPGERATVELDLPPRAFQYWDPTTDAWTADDGEFEIRAGASSRDIRQSVWVTLSTPV